MVAITVQVVVIGRRGTTLFAMIAGIGWKMVLVDKRDFKRLSESMFSPSILF